MAGWTLRDDDVMVLVLVDVHGTEVEVPIVGVTLLHTRPPHYGDNSATETWPMGQLLARGARLRRADGSETLDLAAPPSPGVHAYNVEPR